MHWRAVPTGFKEFSWPLWGSAIQKKAGDAKLPSEWISWRRQTVEECQTAQHWSYAANTNLQASRAAVEQGPGERRSGISKPGNENIRAQLV
jgi:hypothetical protein